MYDINNREGVEQVIKALSALERPRRQTDHRLKEEEELALKQMISGIIPEWRHTDNKGKKGVIDQLGSWTVEMTNCARIQMKTWTAMKNEHKADVQRRWDNRGKMNKAFQTWRSRVRHEGEEQAEGKEQGDKRMEREKTYGIKHWGKDTLKKPKNGCLGTPEAYILARGVTTIPYHRRWGAADGA
eukprot:2975223-Pleurochrysis_carterae.AAC.1